VAETKIHTETRTWPEPLAPMPITTEFPTRVALQLAPARNETQNVMDEWIKEWDLPDDDHFWTNVHSL
jgi:hypothetical protein